MLVIKLSVSCELDQNKREDLNELPHFGLLCFASLVS